MQYRKILLISPEYNFPYSGGMYPNGGLLSIGTVLKRKGCEVKLIHMVPDKYDIAAVEDTVRRFQPDLVGISVTTFQWKSAQEIARVVKSVDSGIGVVIGGPHVSAVGASMSHASFPDADMAVFGEAEETMADIVDGTAAMIIESPQRVEDLDALPLPDLSLINLDNFTSPAPPGPRPSMSMMCQRGCPYRCTFCSRAVFGNTVRRMSPERVVEEVEYLRDYGIREIFFHDDTFNLKRDWAMEVFELIIKKGLDKLRYKAPFRADAKLIDADLLRLAKRAGVWLIFYGVESGNQDMLDRMHKGLNLDEIRRAFSMTHRAGIKTTASFIVGYPGETEATIRQSWQFAKELNPFWVGFSRLTPFPGTEVSETLRRNGHLTDKGRYYDFYRPDKVFARTDALPVWAIEQWAQKLDGWTQGVKLGHLLRHPSMAYQVLKDKV